MPIIKCPECTKTREVTDAYYTAKFLKTGKRTLCIICVHTCRPGGSGMIVNYIGVQCPRCGKWRTIPLTQYTALQVKGRPTYCGSCSQIVAKEEGRGRVIGYKHKKRAVECPKCGRRTKFDRDTINRLTKLGTFDATCNVCIERANDLARRLEAMPAVPVRAHSTSKVSYRCHGLWTECEKYDLCLTYVNNKGWNGFVCSKPGPKCVDVFEVDAFDGFQDHEFFHSADMFDDDMSVERPMTQIGKHK